MRYGKRAIELLKNRYSIQTSVNKFNRKHSITS